MKQFSQKTNFTSNHSTNNSLIRIALPAAILGGTILIVYFLIIKSLGLQMQTQLRWVNFILIIPIAFYAINKYVLTTSPKSYLEAFTISLAACSGSYFPLSSFMVIYLLVDPVFMDSLIQLALPELQLNEISIFILLMGEGFLGGVIISFVTLQFYIERIKKVV